MNDMGLLTVVNFWKLRHKQFSKVDKLSLLIALVMFWSVIGPNIFGIEKVEAAITKRGSTTGATGVATATTVTINTPTGTIEGDVMIAIISVGEGNAFNPTPPTGWANVTGANINTGTTAGHVRMAAFYRVATSTEGASHTFTIASPAKHISGGIISYAGVNATSPFDCTTATTNGVTAATAFAVGAAGAGCVTGNANSVVIAAFGAANDTTITPAANQNVAQDFYVKSGDLLTAPDVSTLVSSGVQAVAGSAGVKNATAGTSSRYVGLLFSLRAAVHQFELSAFRWYTNVNSIDFLGISDDVDDAACGVGALMDKTTSIVQDASTSSVYMIGYDGCNGEQWHIERRGVADGVLVDTFDTDGVVTYNQTSPANQSDRANIVVADGAGSSGSIYVGGYETITSALANNKQWRLEKRSKLTGALVTGFGTGGVITADLAAGTGKDDRITALYIDNTNGFIYVAGEDSSPLVDGTQWRLEKRNATTGALCDGTSPGGTPVCVGGSFGTNGVYTSNPSTVNDVPVSVFVDETDGYVYFGGRQKAGDEVWRVEKIRATTGLICSTTTNCPEGIFATAGAYTSDPNTQNGASDLMNAVEVEIKSTTSKYVYLGGSERGSGSQLKWRMEKLNAITGAICSSTANCPIGVFDVDGIYTIDPDSSENDEIMSFAVDSFYDHVYLVGSDGGRNDVTNARDYKWRVQKHNSKNGAICDGSLPGGVPVCGTYVFNSVTYNFPMYGGTGGDVAGVATSNPVTEAININDHDEPSDMVISKASTSSFDGALYITGYDRGEDTAGTGDTQWRLEKRNLLDGTRQFDLESLAPTNNVGKPQKVNTKLRLRFLLHLAPADLYTTDTLPTFKLQYAPKKGTCDTAFVDEVYTDVTTNTNEIRWLDNSTATDGAMPRELGTSDPLHPLTSSHTNVIQGYEESNPINVRANLLTGRDGLWDLALQDVNAFGAFCFRTVYAGGQQPDGTLLNAAGVGGAYTFIPEINLCLNPSPEVLTRHGSYFCGNVENPFFWSFENLN